MMTGVVAGKIARQATAVHSALKVGGQSFRRSAERYFFREGGAYSIAICRFALFAYFYVHLIGDADKIIDAGASYLARANLAGYYPKSIVWLLFPTAPPSAFFIDLVLLTAKVSTIAAALGLLTRPAMIASTFANLFLGSLIFSWEPLWSHPYNSGLIAALAFCWGRAGDTLSIDALIARALGRPISLNRDVYWWPVILGQFGVATVYFGGFYAKWSTTAFSYDLSWVFSDNLRNSIVLPWQIRGEALPWNVGLIASSPFIWKLSALGHMVTQFLPILALLSLNRPWLRLAEGTVFAAGIVLLKFIMGMWNRSWAILTAFFVDWEFFIKKAGLALPHSGQRMVRYRRPTNVVIWFSILFMASNLVVILTRFDDTGKNRFYPLSSMGFYSSVLAQKPFGEHKHFPFIYGEAIFNLPNGERDKWPCAPGIASSYVATYESANDALERVQRQASTLRAIVASSKREGDINAECSGVVRATEASSVDLYSSILNIPPYPEKPIFEVGHRALVARYERDADRYIAASAQVKWTGSSASFTVASRGLVNPGFQILLVGDPWKNRRPVTFATQGTWQGDTFVMDPAAYKALDPGSYPIVVRAIEPSGGTYDFFGGIIYR